MENNYHSLSQVAGFRQGVYRLLAAWFLYPDEEILNISPAMAKLMHEMEEISLQFPFYSQWSSLLHKMDILKPSDLNALQENYMELFGGSGENKAIPLMESAYMADQQSMGILLASLAQEYKASGVNPAQGPPPDHISVELEFMSSLCEQEAEIWEEEKKPSIHLQKNFLRHHLFSWVFTLHKRVNERKEPHGFYHLLMSTLTGFIAQEMDYLEYLGKL
jgi:TorA maturation chaperone TorD